MEVPTELIPHCPKCGAPMTMNLRSDNTFVEDAGWYAAARRYEDFVRRHENAAVFYLELGVGMNTPAIIKYPFWQMTPETHKRSTPASITERHSAAGYCGAVGLHRWGYRGGTETIIRQQIPFLHPPYGMLPAFKKYDFEINLLHIL